MNLVVYGNQAILQKQLSNKQMQTGKEFGKCSMPHEHRRAIARLMIDFGTPCHKN